MGSSVKTHHPSNARTIHKIHPNNTAWPLQISSLCCCPSPRRRGSRSKSLPALPRRACWRRHRINPNPLKPQTHYLSNPEPKTLTSTPSCFLLSASFGIRVSGFGPWTLQQALHQKVPSTQPVPQRAQLIKQGLLAYTRVCRFRITESKATTSIPTHAILIAGGGRTSSTARPGPGSNPTPLATRSGCRWRTR